MTTVISEAPKKLMADHYKALSAYAKRVAHQGDPLTDTEETDKTRRLEEFFAVGIAVGCTKRELATLLYRGLFRAEQKCGCVSCETRTSTK